MYTHHCQQQNAAVGTREWSAGFAATGQAVYRLGFMRLLTAQEQAVLNAYGWARDSVESARRGRLVACASHRSIAEALGCRERSVRRAERVLEEAGLIDVEPPRGRRPKRVVVIEPTDPPPAALGEHLRQLRKHLRDGAATTPRTMRLVSDDANGVCEASGDTGDHPKRRRGVTGDTIEGSPVTTKATVEGSPVTPHSRKKSKNMQARSVRAVEILVEAGVSEARAAQLALARGGVSEEQALDLVAEAKRRRANNPGAWIAGVLAKTGEPLPEHPKRAAERRERERGELRRRDAERAAEGSRRRRCELGWDAAGGLIRAARATEADLDRAIRELRGPTAERLRHAGRDAQRQSPLVRALLPRLEAHPESPEPWPEEVEIADDEWPSAEKLGRWVRSPDDPGRCPEVIGWVLRLRKQREIDDAAEAINPAVVAAAETGSDR